MIEFYFAPDTCSLATHIALEEARVETSCRHIDIDKGQNRSPEYLSINPKGRVPAMVTERGTLTETPAMLAYVAQAFPEARLAPLEDLYAFAQIQAFNSYLCSTLHIAHAHRMRGHRWADGPEAIAAMQRKVPESVGKSYDYIERHAFTGPFVMGGEFTIADPYLFTLAQWMEADGVDPARMPKVAAHRELMRMRPSVQRALQAEAV